jgi:protein phosphatase
MAAQMQRRRVFLAVAGLTDVGRQRRHNEDHVLIRPELGLYVVADGMGGHNAGNVASRLTTTSLQNFFEATRGAPPPGTPTAQDAEFTPDSRRLVAGIRKANRDVFEISSTVQQHHGMGSTVVAAFVSNESGRIHVAHVGDSRCYRIRGGIIRQVTTDHSLVHDALAFKPDLTEEELGRLPRNIITRALGMRDTVDVDVTSDDVAVGDVYLLCSDGLSGMVRDEQIVEVVSMSDDLGEACELLIAMANDAGGNDNISAVLLRIADELEDAEPVTVARPDEVARGGEPDPALADTLDGDAPEATGDEAPATEVAAPAATIAPATEDDEVAALVAEHAVEPALRRSDEPTEEELFAEVERLLSDPPPGRSPSRRPTPPPVPIPAAYCHRCGFELFEGNLFCVECGAPIDQGAVAASWP